MNGTVDEIKEKFLRGNAATRFIFVNVTVFLLLNIIRLVFWLMQLPKDAFRSVLHFLSVPAHLPNLAVKPWTIITYMFVHFDFWHILFNMFVLFFGGRIFLEYMNNKKFISTYFLGGISGAIIYIIAYNVFPVFELALQHSVALGASASVLAVLVAAATFVPNYTVNLLLIGPVRLKFIAMFLILLDIISIPGDNPGGHLAHLGGAIYGYVYISRLKKGSNIAGWFDGIADFFANLFSRNRSRMKVSYSNSRITDEQYSLLKRDKQQRIDEILDKISKSGYESLTKEEKEFLFKASKNL
jgi:membrane associated rhomboid family serine protease